MKNTATSSSTRTHGRYRIHDDDPFGVGDGGRPSPGLPSGRRPGGGSDGGRLMAAPREANRPSLLTGPSWYGLGSRGSVVMAGPGRVGPWGHARSMTGREPRACAPRR